MTNKEIRMVLVIWHDAHSTSETWQHEEDIDDEPCIVKSIGWYLHNWKRGHVAIAQSIEGEYRDSVLAIPKKMVQKVIDLSESS